jgi:LacI family transcriptional regulator
MIKSKNNVNIRDVAKAAGISIATVSKAINNKPDISQERRAKIFEICESLGYTVNTNIQDMVRISRSGITRNIAFVLVNRKFSMSSYSIALDGITKATDEYGLHLILETLTGKEKSRYELPPMLRDSRIDGIIMTGDLNFGIVNAIKNIGLPYVILGAYDNAITDGAINVLPDIREGMLSLVKTLYNKGKRKIAYFSERTDTFSGKTFLNAYKSALVEHNIQIEESLIYTGGKSYSGAYNVMQPVFQKENLPFDSILCIDPRTAQEIACLIMAHYGFRQKPDIIMGLAKSSENYKFMFPVIFSETLMDKVAYEGVRALINNINNRNEFTDKKIIVNSIIIEEQL